MTNRVKRVAAGMARGGFETAGREAASLAGTIARPAWLAGLGAAVAAGEAGVATFESLVEKGRRRRQTPVEKLERQLAQTRREIEHTGRAAYRQVAGFLEQLGVPSQNEIRALRARLEALRERLS